MAEFVRQHASALALSTLLHVMLLAALGVSFRFEPRRVPIVPMAIEATVVDESALRAQRERERAAEQERQRAAEAREREARQRAEAERQAAAAEQRRLEQQRRQQEREAQAAAERERQQKAEAERQARLQAEREAKAKAEAEARAKAEAERRRQAAEEAARQAAMEEELRLALAEEEALQAAEDAGLLDQYVQLIEQRIERNWIRPASAGAGLECVVKVSQIPSGDVVSVRIGRCNGDEAVIRSIEAAVLRASPLPKPPTPRLFDRNLEVIFRPDS